MDGARKWGNLTQVEMLGNMKVNKIGITFKLNRKKYLYDLMVKSLETKLEL